MRVVLWTHHTMFEPALSLSASLADRVEVHLIVEVPHDAWPAANFRASVGTLGPGLHEADPILAPHHPPETRAMWRAAASAHVLVTSKHRARHPSSLAVMRRALRWVAELEPDVVHLDDVDVSPRLALALPTVRRPYALVVGCHDPDPHSGEADWRVKALTRRIVLPRADAVVVHHEGGREPLRRRHPRLRAPVRVVPLGAYAHLAHGLLNARPTDAAPGPPTVALFGRLTPYKGLDLLYAAAPAVAAAVPGVRMVVAGAPVGGYLLPAPPEADGLVVEVRPEYQTTAQLGSLCRSSSVVVCPYTDASQSGVVLTAFAFGVPVVVTDVGGLAEYVEDGRTGLVVPADDAVALAAAIVRVLAEPGLGQRLREGVSRAVVGDLSWSRSATVLVRLYGEVTRRQG